MISLEKCIAEIEFRFPGVASNPATSEEWQTLKAAVLAQQTTNKQIMPVCPHYEVEWVSSMSDCEIHVCRCMGKPA